MLCFYKENIYEMAKCYTNVITQVLNESQNDISKLHKFFSFFFFQFKILLIYFIWATSTANNTDTQSTSHRF